MMSRKITLDEVKDRLYKSHGSNISIIEYTQMKSRATFLCNICGHIWERYTSDVVNGDKCPNCRWKEHADRKRLSYDFIKNQVEKDGYTLLSKKYIKSGEKIIISCPKGHIFYMGYNSWQRGQRCPTCGRVAGSLKQRISVNTIKNMMSEYNLIFLGFKNEYINRKSVVIHKCRNNHIIERSLDSFYMNGGCPTCNILNGHRKTRGQNNWNWKGGLTPIRTQIIRAVTDWRIKSIKNSNFKCVISGDRFENVHHLYSLNLIMKEALDETELEKCFIVGDYSDANLTILLNKIIEIHSKYPLGVCLRKDIHILFHQLYGNGDNTPEQWYDFVAKIKNGDIRIKGVNE